MAKKAQRSQSKSQDFVSFTKARECEHFGDCKPVGNGIWELKIDYAQGYRVYFVEMDGKIIVLLFGGDKSSQRRDIEKAKEILKRIKK